MRRSLNVGTGTIQNKPHNPVPVEVEVVDSTDIFDEHIVKRGLATKASVNAARASEGKKPIKE